MLIGKTNKLTRAMGFGLLLWVAVAHARSYANELIALSSEWVIATAYPADTVSGRAAEDFASLLNQANNVAAVALPRFNEKTVSSRSPDSTDLPFRVEFSGDWATRETILALSTSPYTVKSVEEACAISRIARPAYRAALSHYGFVLLAVIPWPPTGIWSRSEISSPKDFVGMRVRTYDESSKLVLEALGAHVVSLPIQEALAQIKTGGVDAVMSSGDGAAGRAYASDLPNFTALRYAYPVSFLVASRHFLDGLSASQRSVIFAAGWETERRAWARLPDRVRRNYEMMATLGVAVHDPAPASLLDAVVRTATGGFRKAVTKDSEAIGILERFRACSASGCGTCTLDVQTEASR
ncbi:MULTISPECIES: TRAP transporter substrate-binding protein DctP [Burkholderia]|uniref:TRAP transporter substrate-binding protein DctP n=1 Tax=Burkholderia TaxID=32008 RepID=UPI000327FC85|nr:MULTISPECIES: TRAP transporter substrate-binding protein DctP [Burkholderia]AGK49998.1 bacterial extracellular solute-binding, 7 family protein [Burkholderia thailandensis MSMB121]ATF33893.1 C4-dicarboxylate ABC transporter substrate-binding protein [Burkholderia thailandensis]